MVLKPPTLLRFFSFYRLFNLLVTTAVVGRGRGRSVRQFVGPRYPSQARSLEARRAEERTLRLLLAAFY